MAMYSEGDLIEAVKGDTRLRGRLTDALMGELGVDGMGWPIPSLERDGFTITVIEKAKPKVELPVEDGAYVDKHGTDVWTITPFHELRCVSNPGSSPEKYAPFTKLEPRAVTAKAVIERLASWWEFGPPKNFADEFAQIANEFGVTND